MTTPRLLSPPGPVWISLDSVPPIHRASMRPRSPFPGGKDMMVMTVSDGGAALRMQVGEDHALVGRWRAGVLELGTEGMAGMPVARMVRDPLRRKYTLVRPSEREEEEGEELLVATFSDGAFGGPRSASVLLPRVSGAQEIQGSMGCAWRRAEGGGMAEAPSSRLKLLSSIEPNASQSGEALELTSAWGTAYSSSPRREAVQLSSLPSGGPVFQLAPTPGPAGSWLVAAAYPLSPVHALALAAASLNSEAEGAPVAVVAAVEPLLSGAFDSGGGSSEKRVEGRKNLDNRKTQAVPVKRRWSLEGAVGDLADEVQGNPAVLNLCLLSLALSFAVDLYPSAPQYNTVYAAASLWMAANMGRWEALGGRTLYYVYSLLSLFLLAMDVGFLAGGTRVSAVANLLDPFGPDGMGAQVAAGMDTAAVIGVGILVAVKVLAWQAILASSPQGRTTLGVLWRRLRLFLPIWGEPSRLTKEVYDRIIALAWLHLLASVGLLLTAGITGFTMDWAPQFGAAGVGATLSLLCFLKAITLSLVVMGLFRNMDLALCLNVFGCMACADRWHRARERRRRRKHGTHYPKIILEWDYIMGCCWVKVVDMCLGVWVWCAIAWSWDPSLEFHDRWNVRMLLAFVTVTQFFTDIWSIFLGAVICLLVSQHLLRKAHTRARVLGGDARDAESDGVNSDLLDSDSGSEHSGSGGEHSMDDGPHAISSQRVNIELAQGDADLEAPLPGTARSIILDPGKHIHDEEFHNLWSQLKLSGSFRVRLATVPPLHVLTGHLHSQGFVVVASGAVADTNKVYASASSDGGVIFLMEMLIEKAVHELTASFKCQQPDMTPSFVRHLRLRDILGEHQPIA